MRPMTLRTAVTLLLGGGILGAVLLSLQAGGSGRPADDIVEDLVEQGVVSGEVLQSDGSAAPGAHVFLSVSSWPEANPRRHAKSALNREPIKTVADNQGRYHFKGTPRLRTLLREYRVRIWAKLNGQVSPWILVRGAQESGLVAPLRLGPALWPKLRVVTKAGSPVVNAHAELTLDDDAGRSSGEASYVLGARTDEAGLAVFPPVPERPYWGALIEVDAHGMPLHQEMTRTLTRLWSGEGLAVRVSAGFTVRGRAELPDGAPGVSVMVSARRHQDPSTHRNSTRTARDGSFELGGVPTRGGVVEFAELPQLEHKSPEPTLQPARARSARFQLTKRVKGREGQTVDLGTVRLLRTLTIRGKVLGPNDRPPRGGCIVLGGRRGSCSLAPDGSFETGAIESGTYTVKAIIFEGDDPGELGLEATMTDVEAGSNVVIRVTGGGNLIVRFHPVGRRNQPLDVFEPSICSGDGGGATGRGKRADMRMTLQPGWHRDLYVEAQGYKRALLGPIHIHSDRMTVVDVELEPAN